MNPGGATSMRSNQSASVRRIAAISSASSSGRFFAGFARRMAVFRAKSPFERSGGTWRSKAPAGSTPYRRTVSVSFAAIRAVRGFFTNGLLGLGHPRGMPGWAAAQALERMISHTPMLPMMKFGSQTPTKGDT